MAHLQASGISLAFGDRDILSSVTLTLASGERCALAGANGSGKSSLMKIMTGLANADEGEVHRSEGAVVAYLPQSGISHSGLSLAEEIDTAYDGIAELIAKRDELGEELGKTSDGDGDVEALVAEHHELEERIQQSGFYDRAADIDRVLSGLGFRTTDLRRPTDEFSGGWQMRIALAKVLLVKPDFLLLDEPTNYLDVEARVWLSRFLASYAGGVLLVSHDRQFLDETIGAVWELFGSKLRRYGGTYTQYETQREQEIAQIKAAWMRQQEEIARIEDFIRRFRATASKAKQVQSRIKMLEKMERIEIPEHLKHIHVTFPPAPHSGREVVRLHNVTRNYGANQVLDRVEIVIERRQRVVLVGPNGAGKSTLMRIIAGNDAEHHGQVIYGSGVRSGFYADDDNWLSGRVSVAVDSISVIDAVLSITTGHTEQQVRNLLGAFLFRGEDIYKDVRVLSGGERSRLAMLQLLLQPKNLLILDEPTNHLDMASKDVLLDALQQFGGTIVFVSHDRRFIEKLATRVVELAPDPRSLELPSAVRDFPGDYSYYAWRLSSQDQPGDGSAASGPAPSPVPDRPAAEKASPPPSHAEMKARRSRIQRVEREIDHALAEIEKLGARSDRIHAELARPEVYSDGEEARRRQVELTKIKSRVHRLTVEWERLVAEHESLTGD
jgi:ATP-binding cassette subfamily F protein 3